MIRHAVRALTVCLLACAVLSPARAAAQDLTVQSMTLERAGDAETFCITFGGEYIPEAKSLENGDLRVYFDVYGLPGSPAVQTPSPAGPRIVALRTGYEAPEKRFRVVLDLDDAGNYRIGQHYFEETNRFCLSVQQE